MAQPLRIRIAELDYEKATPHDVAVLIEQVFLDSATTAEAGALSFVRNILERYSQALQRCAESDLYQKMDVHAKKLRALTAQTDEQARKMEMDLYGRHA